MHRISASSVTFVTTVRAEVMPMPFIGSFSLNTVATLQSVCKALREQRFQSDWRLGLRECVE